MAAALSTRHMYLLWQDVELRHLLFSGDKAKESGALVRGEEPQRPCEARLEQGQRVC